MKRRSVLSAGFTLTAASICSGAWAASASGPLRALSVGDFRQSGVRGVGFGNLRQGPHNSEDMDALAALGVNHVRVFIEIEREPGRESYRIPPEQLKALDDTLQALERRGIRLVLVGGFGPDARADLWRSDKLKTSAIAIWDDLARRLRGRTSIAAFDIVNEPVPPGLNYGIRQDNWLEFATRAIETIRRADPGRVVIVEAAPDALPTSFDTLRVLPFDNLVYSLHSYVPFNMTHQVVMPEFAQARRYPDTGPDGRSTTQALVDSLDVVRNFTAKNDVPIYVGEFSAIRYAPDGSAARYVADSIALFTRYGWSWSYHEFRGWHGWDPEMASSERDNTRRSVDAPVIRALRSGLSGR